MNLSSVGVQHADLPGLVDEPYRNHSSIAIGLQHPPPAQTANGGTPPSHLQQQWAQHISTIHSHAHINPHARHFPLPPPLLHSNQPPATASAAASSSPPPPVNNRPSPFLLSLRIGDEVDALDEIGYRQWRHAFIMELGHIPGQTVDDSGQVGEYKIRWAGWDAKWDEVRTAGTHISPRIASHRITRSYIPHITVVLTNRCFHVLCSVGAWRKAGTVE